MRRARSYCSSCCSCGGESDLREVVGRVAMAPEAFSRSPRMDARPRDARSNSSPVPVSDAFALAFGTLRLFFSSLSSESLLCFMERPDDLNSSVRLALPFCRGIGSESTKRIHSVGSQKGFTSSANFMKILSYTAVSHCFSARTFQSGSFGWNFTLSLRRTAFYIQSSSVLVLIKQQRCQCASKLDIK